MIALDHLVVAARTLDDGVAWCEATLGVTPGPGGRHPLMGTHNRLFSIASTTFPKAYAEIIAVDGEAPAPGRARWFGLDAWDGEPQLLHWVLRCDDIDRRRARLAARGVDLGDVLAASRATPTGLLEWRITVRGDGALVAAGAVPTLIQWGERHPVDDMPDSGVRLLGLDLARVPVPAMSEVALPGTAFVEGDVPICARLSTPRGEVTLGSARRT